MGQKANFARERQLLFMATRQRGDLASSQDGRIANHSSIPSPSSSGFPSPVFAPLIPGNKLIKCDEGSFTF